MAIKIPSKSIYQKENLKVSDNIIDLIEISAKEITTSYQYDTNVYNKEFKDFQSTFELIENKGIDSVAYGAIGVGAGLVAYAKYYNHLFFNGTIDIPKVINNKLITEIKHGIDENGIPDIKWELSGVVSSRNANAEWTGTIGSFEIGGDVSITEGEVSLGENTVDRYGSFTIPQKLEPSIEIEHDLGTSTAKVELELKDNIDWGNISFQEGQDIYRLQIKILCGISTLTLTGGAYSTSSSTLQFPLSGENITYNADTIKISFYGNTIGIDLNDKTIQIGNKNGNNFFSMEGNELMQITNSYYLNKEQVGLSYGDIENTGERRIYVYYVNQKPREYHSTVLVKNGSIDLIITIPKGNTSKTISSTIEEGEVKIENVIISPSIINSFENTLSHYINGKETATLLCDIADYYDENGDKVIDTKTKKMSFRLHDEVIPYVFGANGQDQPMSKYQDGTAKVFEVIGSNIIYDGAVWQELSLLEKK